jgi:nitrate reductase NapE component
MAVPAACAVLPAPLQQAVIVGAIGFIVCVFILHIFGKLRS